MATHQNLGHRQTAELLRQMSPTGKCGFDYKQHKLAVLRATVSHWIASGVCSEETAEALAQAISSQPIALPAPGAGPLAAPVVVLAPPTPIAAPPVSPHVPAPASEWRDGPIAAAVRSGLGVAEAIAALPDPAPGQGPDDEAPEAEAAPGAVPHNTMAHPAPIKVKARDLFADQPDVAEAIPADCEVWHYRSPLAPPVDNGYFFDPDNTAIALLSMALRLPAPIWLGGPKSTGKTEFCKQLAARLGREFFRVGFNRATEPSEIMGDMGLQVKEGRTVAETVWSDGPVTMGLRTPGALILLDEVTQAAPGYLSSMNAVLERGGAALRLPRTGAQLDIARDVFIVAADNTMGHGDDSGEYPRNKQSADFLERFPYKLKFAYLPPDKEAALLVGRVARDSGGRKLKLSTAKAIVKLATVAREKGDAGTLPGAPGFRLALGMALLMVSGIKAERAYSVTMLSGAPPDSQETLREIFATHWPAADLDVNAAAAS